MLLAGLIGRIVGDRRVSRARVVCDRTGDRSQAKKNVRRWGVDIRQGPLF